MTETTVAAHSPKSDFKCPIGLWIPVFTLLFLYGCAHVGPDYEKPQVKSPKAWHSELDKGLNPTALNPKALANWWTQLNDPLLTDIMGRALAGNLNLQTARARVREARARRGISKASYFPTLDANGSYAKSQASKSTTSSDLMEEFGIEPNRETELYSVGLDSSWEIDIFGGVARSVEAADADLAASQEEYYGVLVSLLAETALTYIDIRTSQARIEVAEANLNALKETYQITRSRFRAGLTDELAVQGARYALYGNQAQIPTLRTHLGAAMNGLAVLLGEMPGTLHTELSIQKPIPVPPKEVAVGVPAETLRNRPDVRQAERQLAAQTARIGVAKSDLYPKFSLFGTVGYEALTEDNLFDPGNLIYRYGPRISWGLFRGGAIKQNIEIQNARQEQALKQYHATVLGAVQEAEDAVSAYIGEQNRRNDLIAATQSATQAFTLARNQYQAGLVDFSVVLVAQQSMLSYKDQLAQSEGTVTTDLVRLYKSLGGGWNTEVQHTPKK